MNENDFWTTFLPNGVATLMGVIVGVPIAMWLNRLSLSATIRRDELEARTRLGHGVESVIATLTQNQDGLQAIAVRVGEGRIPFDSAIDAAAWDTSRDEIVPFLRDPDLHRRLGFHFSRLDSLRRLTATYLEVMLGRTTSTAIVQEDLRQQLLREVNELRRDATQLVAELRARRTK